MTDTDRTADFCYEPYWWVADRSVPRDPSPATIPPKVDVLIIGGGVTGVEAALVLTQAGRDVLILDAGVPGRGASSRNAGQIGRNFKHSFSELMETRGLAVAKEYFLELRAAYDGVARIAAQAGADIGWRKCGRIVSAMTPALFEKLQREYSLRAQHIGEEIEIVGPNDIRGEMNSPIYHGGVRILENGSIQPARYYQFLRDRAEQAGARIIADTAVRSVSRTKEGFVATTTAGSLAAREVLVATNGYTDAALPWFHQRLAPIDAFMIATEPLSAELIGAVLPHLRTYHDNRRRSHYMTFSPDGQRLLFGGRTGTLPSKLPAVAAALHADLRFLFPPLQETKISHAWTGRCAGTADLYPHVGVHEGMHFAVGYCFSGMAMGPYLARKAAARILGQTDAAHTVFETQEFSPLPVVARGPWLGPLLAGYWAWADRPPGLGRAI